MSILTCCFQIKDGIITDSEVNGGESFPKILPVGYIKVKGVNLSQCLISYVICHEDLLGCGGITPFS
jgi:hypothetical protein